MSLLCAFLGGRWREAVEQGGGGGWVGGGLEQCGMVDRVEVRSPMVLGVNWGKIIGGEQGVGWRGDWD